MSPKMLVGVPEVAAAWGVSTQRIRELIHRHALIPEYESPEPRYYWNAIPERKGHHDAEL